MSLVVRRFVSKIVVPARESPTLLPSSDAGHRIAVSSLGRLRMFSFSFALPAGFTNEYA